MTDNDPYNNFRIPVPPEYEALFSHFYFAENNAREAVTKTLLPSYQTIMVFSFGANVYLESKQGASLETEKCLVLGPIKQSFRYTLSPGSKILVANFKDDAFYRFFGNASVAEHLPINPDELLEENCFTALWTELRIIPDVQEQVNYILRFCKPYLSERNLIAERISDFDAGNLNPIKTLANEQGQTERNLQLNHKKYFGFSAKELNRYQRFIKATELIETRAFSSSKIDWFEIISECGYYDQSQLIHDFKHYMNISPTKYVRFQQDICDPNP